MRTIPGTMVLTIFLGAGCGSNGPSQVDAPPQKRDAALSPDLADCVCDEATLGEHYCIINPCGSVGNGTVVARQNPVPYQSCKQ